MELPDRAAKESAFATNLSRSFSDYRSQIEPYLNRGEPVPDSVYADIRRDTQQKLAAILILLFTDSAVSHGADASAIEPYALAFANQRSTDLASQLVANTQQRLTGIVPNAATEVLATTLGPERAATIAVTETTVATSAGGERGVEMSVGVAEADLWITERDAKVCPVCAPLDNATRSVWHLQFPGGPPGHPNCRCWISYQFERN